MQLELATPGELEAVLRDRPAVVVPVGSVEWHDEHLPLGFDTIKIHELAVRISERAGCAAAPPIFYGYPKHFHQRKMTGTLCPDLEALRGYVKTVGSSLLATGFRVMLLLSGHYERSQIYLLKLTAEELMDEHPQTVVFAHMDPDYTVKRGVSHNYREDTVEPGFHRGDHAGPFETSLMMHLRPELVRTEMLGKVKTETTRGDFAPSAEAGRELTEMIVSKAAGEIAHCLRTGQKPPGLL